MTQQSIFIQMVHQDHQILQSRRGLKWHVPTFNKKGINDITGADNLRKIQEEAMKKTKKRF